MRPEVWTGLVVMTVAFTVCPLQAKPLANAEGMQRSHILRRLIRDTFSTSLRPSSTPFPTSWSPSVSAFPLISQSPSSSTSLPSSSSPTSPSLFSSSFSSAWSSPPSTLPSSSTPTSAMLSLTTPPSSTPSSSSFSSSTSLSSLSLSSSSWPFSSSASLSSLSPNLPSSFSSLSSTPAPPTPSSPLSSSPSFSSLTSPSPPSPRTSSSISSTSPFLTSISSSSSSSSQTSSASLPSRSSLNPSSSSLPSSSYFMIPPSHPLPFSFETQFSPSMSLTFHLLSTSFQRLSSAFELLSASFQLLSNAYQLPISPIKSTLTSVPTSPLPVSSSLPPLPTEGPSGFWGNGSLIGLELECDDAAKSCLSIGRLLHEPTGQCYRLGDVTPCETGHSLVLDAEALRNGRLRTVCRRNDPCDGPIMAYDGQCHDAKDIRNVLCNTSATVVPYPTGLYECACYTADCLLGTAPVRQVSVPGKCVLPDLNRPPMGPFRMACSAEMANCSRKLFFKGECYVPLANASCPEGQWLVLDEHASNLSATCVSKQPCGPGGQRLHADGLCHSEEEIRDKLCPGEKLYPLPNGDMQCSDIIFYMSVVEENGMCTVTVNRFHMPQDQMHFFAGKGPNSKCTRNDKGVCSPEVKPA